MRALIVVDVQKDFIEGGSLAVEGGTDVAKAISEYLNLNPDRYDKIVVTRDWHSHGEDNGGHFSETPDYKDTWPAHCVAGTKGAEFANELAIYPPTYVDVQEIRKGQHKPAYSGFEGKVVGTGRLLDQLLASANIVDICGIAFDYCVKATALDARKLLPYAQVNVLLDLTASVAKGTSIVAAVDMTAAGVNVAPTWVLDIGRLDHGQG